MRAFAVLAVACAGLLFLAGCASNRPLAEPASSLSEINGVLADRTARLYLTGQGGSGRNASLVTLTPDSVYYVRGILPRHSVAPQGGRPTVSKPLSLVDSIGVPYDGGGGRSGALLGATPGLLSGARLGISVANNCSEFCSLGAAITVGYTVLVAGGGALIGALIGNSVDDDVQTVYRYPVSQYSPDAPDAARSER